MCETFHEKSIEKSRVIFLVLKTKLHKLQSRGNISCCSFSFCLDNLYEQSGTYNLHKISVNVRKNIYLKLTSMNQKSYLKMPKKKITK